MDYVGRQKDCCCLDRLAREKRSLVRRVVKNLLAFDVFLLLHKTVSESQVQKCGIIIYANLDSGVELWITSDMRCTWH